MARLTDEMKEIFKKSTVWPLATASKSGEPNVAPMKAVWLVDEETIWIADNYMKKTLANLMENPRAALYCWGAETGGCLEIKGDVAILTAGPDYEKMRADMRAKSEKFPAKSLIVISITDIFTCNPGPGAGDRL
ncbi:MAG: pyridoxamine 5-phosphate oxidase [Methanomicrobiales archaeon]|nr:pyridoxamine 5-phosphate oxidase [Methanomicrobiales archaeon]